MKASNCWGFDMGTNPEVGTTSTGRVVDTLTSDAAGFGGANHSQARHSWQQTTRT